MLHQIHTYIERVQIGALALGGFIISPVLMCYAFLSCSDPMTSLPAGPIIAATGLDGGRVLVLDATTGRLLRTAGPALRAQSYPAVSPDSTTLYYTGLALSGGGRGLVALEPANGRVRWNLQPLDTVFTGPLVGEVTTLGAGQFLVGAEAGAPDRLLWYVSRRGSLSGLASVDPPQKAASAFVAMHAAAIHVPILRGTGHLPSGTVLVCGTRNTAAGRPRANTLFFLSSRLEVLDSVVLPVTNFEAYDVAVTADERTAYVKAYPELFKVDLVSRSITRQAQVPYYGSVVMLADSLLVVTDPGTGLSVPSSGRVYLYSAELESRGSIDLSPIAPGGIPPTNWDAVLSTDGSKLFVIAGTPELTAGQAPQRAGVFVIDVQTRRAESYVSLGEFGGQRLFRMK